MEFLKILNGTIWILIEQGLSVFIVFPIVSVVIVGLLLPGIVQMFQQRPVVPMRFLLYLCIATLIPTVMALVGVIFWDTNNQVAQLITLFLFALNVLCIVAASIRERGRRVFIIAVGIFFFIWTLATSFIVSMAITNVWL
jgi:hypothetical protein